MTKPTDENIVKKDLKIRAIYIGDVRFDNCPVFQLNTETNKFVMVSDDRFQYNDLDVYDDKDFLVFEVYKEETINSDEDVEDFDEDFEEEIIETVKMI